MRISQNETAHKRNLFILINKLIKHQYELFVIYLYLYIYQKHGLLWWFSRKESACSAGNTGSISGQEDPLEEEMETHSSTHAWEIPWTEESGQATVQGVAKESDMT